MRPVLHYRACSLEFGLLEGSILSLVEVDERDTVNV